MPTCLFTGEELDDTTKIEHTIQRAIGGRVKSTLVSSSSFNERCGIRLDPFFCGVYVDVMHILSPLLPLEARSGSIEFQLTGHPGRWQFNDRGQMVLMNPTVIERDPITNRPLSAIGPDIQSLQPMVRQLNSPQFRQSEILPPSNEVLFDERPALHWRIEIAALKALLLTFDHLLQVDAGRFTRTADLQPIRQFVREIVESDSDHPEIDLLADISLGIQYDPEFLQLYDELRAAADLPPIPFSHTLIVSANNPTRTLDMVFLAFNTDPHAFRVSRTWAGESFTYVMTNGILLGTEASIPIKLARGKLLGKPTHRRCRMKVKRLLTDAEKQAAAEELSEHRRNLYQRAVDYVERNCPAQVQEQFSRLARLDRLGDHRVSSAVASHLITLFSGKLRSSVAADSFVALLAPLLDPAANDILGAGSDASTIPGQGWDYWLQRYYRCLDVLREPFGLPGYIFQANQRTEMNQLPP